MKFFKILLIICIFSLFETCFGQKVEMRAFTHPFSLNPIKIYKSLNEKEMFLKPNNEAGWLVTIIDKDGEFFLVSFLEKNNLVDKAWIHFTDLGVVIENYSNLKIPVYKHSCDNLKIEHFIRESITVNVCGFNLEFACVVIQAEGIEQNLWVERKYLCDNPVTTCH